MTEQVNTVVIGAGQAGLSVSHFLKRHAVEHVVLEQSRIAASWRRYWDSFTLVTQNIMNNLPDFPSGGEPNGFLGRDGVIRYLEDFASSFGPPLRTGVRVTSVAPQTPGQGFRVETEEGAYWCRNVVVAAGTFQRPHLPACAASLPGKILQLVPAEYRNPSELPEGAVLVVGSGQSGGQIADELHQSGRKVYLSIGQAGRAPRRYRGRDIMEWFRLLGLFDQTVDQLDSPAERFDPHPHLSGRDGGKTINLRRFGSEGVVLAGKVEGAGDGHIYFAPNLEQNLQAADSFAGQLCGMIDKRIKKAKIDAPPPADGEILSESWSPPEVLRELSLTEAGIAAVVWATGYRFDFTWVKAPIFDKFGYPVQQQGVTSLPGLYFAGLHWLNKLKSGLLYGVAEDAEHVARHIAARQV